MIDGKFYSSCCQAQLSSARDCSTQIGMSRAELSRCELLEAASSSNSQPPPQIFLPSRTVTPHDDSLRSDGPRFSVHLDRRAAHHALRRADSARPRANVRPHVHSVPYVPSMAPRNVERILWLSLCCGRCTICRQNDEEEQEAEARYRGPIRCLLEPGEDWNGSATSGRSPGLQKV